MKITLVFLCLIACGCKVLSQDSTSWQGVPEAQKLMEAGEWYRARKVLESVLEQNPKDANAQKLMAEVLEQEISRHKEIMKSGAAVDLDSEEKKTEAATWLERGRSMLELGQYDEAREAAETVFLYDPNNEKASQLIDEIKRRAYRAGKKDAALMNKMYRQEIKERVELYRREAEEAVQAGRWGSARLAADKILLLLPEDPEALALKEKIKFKKVA